MKERFVYLDNIKVFLISYVITGHIAASYGAIGGGRWNYLESVNDFVTKATLSLFVLVAYSFLMGMFIFIAGYFTFPSLNKKGVVQFAKDRVVRLGLPLVLYYFLIGPFVRYFSKLAKGYDGSFIQFLTESYQSGIYGFMGVMWFVVLILMFSLIYAGFWYFFPKGWYKPKFDTFPTNSKILLFVLVVGFSSFVARIIFPMGGDFAGSRPLGSIVFFGTSFFLGTTAARYNWVETLKFKNALSWAIAAAVAMTIPVVLLVIFRKNLGIGMIAKSGSFASLFYAYWEVIKTLGTGMAFIILFRKWLNKPGKLADTLGKSVFLAYFIHPLICVLFLYAFSTTGLHPLLKFAIVAPTALVTTFATAWLLRLIPVVRKIL
ncbi:MAG: acyltransferase family protein [Bacteroidales bacterium]